MCETEYDRGGNGANVQRSCIQAACSPPLSSPPPSAVSTSTPFGQDLTQREVRMIEDNFVSHRVDRDMM